MKRQLRNALAGIAAVAAPFALTADRSPALGLDEARLAMASRYAAGCAITSVNELPGRPDDPIHDIVVGLRTQIDPYGQRVDDQYAHDPRVTSHFTVVSALGDDDFPSAHMTPTETEPTFLPGTATATLWDEANPKAGTHVGVYITNHVETQDSNGRFRSTIFSAACGSLTAFAVEDGDTVWGYDPNAPADHNVVTTHDCPFPDGSGLDNEDICTTRSFAVPLAGN